MHVLVVLLKSDVDVSEFLLIFFSTEGRLFVTLISDFQAENVVRGCNHPFFHSYGDKDSSALL